MGIKVGICGTGAFADCFIPLFRAHPEVESVVLCDLDGEKLKAKSERYGLPVTCPSLDDLCQTDVEAIAIFSQNWMHGPQAVQALRAGKHVYSAVPSAVSLDEITELVRAVEQTGKTYLIGETSYYYPCAIYCRERFRRGEFGSIVYGEGQYYHDWDHGLYEVMKWRGGVEWKKYAGSPPMYYPTHSMSMIVSVTGAHATKVSCMGYVDHHGDGLFREEVNIWGNVFSNETALLQMSDGSLCRLNEFRRIGHPGTVCMSLYGTEGSYEENQGAQVWITKNAGETTDLRDLLSCSGIPVSQIEGQMARVTSSDGTHQGASKVHPLHLLPPEFIGLPNSHNGSHQFLVHEFVTACLTGALPANNVWQAARYLVPGLIAHESAKRGGELMEVPDFGDAPN
ncbi:MAG: Gfo/Idh/MocA family oxidoreductase [Armatimonadetes bacterium]|nr:Gfo/Idh/MocA family oxidoreductase [Armatimonadota bacterium]